VVLQEVDPQPHAQRQVARVREHGIDAVRRRREVGQHHLQAAVGDLALDLPGAAPGDAQALQAPVVQHLAVAAVQPAAGAQMGQLAVDHEGPAAGLAGVGRQGQALVAHQLRRRFGTPARFR
jgi:hypothetical protein